MPPYTPYKYIGTPPWNELQNQKCMKYASLRFAKENIVESIWLSTLIMEMQTQLEALILKSVRPLIDIRYWPSLKVGDIPGVPGWHYDCFNTPNKGIEDQHVLYFYGAGCRTMFRPDLQPDEGWIIGYDHSAEHRITECTTDGPRLLVRLSHTSIKPVNHIYDQAYVIKFS